MGYALSFIFGAFVGALAIAMLVDYVESARH